MAKCTVHDEIHEPCHRGSHGHNDNGENKQLHLRVTRVTTN